MKDTDDLVEVSVAPHWKWSSIWVKMRKSSRLKLIKRQTFAVDQRTSKLRLFKKDHRGKYFLPNTKIDNDGVDMVDELAAITLVDNTDDNLDSGLRCWTEVLEQWW